MRALLPLFACLLFASPLQAQAVSWTSEWKQTCDYTIPKVGKGALVLELRKTSSAAYPWVVHSSFSYKQAGSHVSFSTEYRCLNDAYLTPIYAAIQTSSGSVFQTVQEAKQGAVTGGVWEARVEKLTLRYRRGRTSRTKGATRHVKQKLSPRSLWAFHHLVAIARWKLKQGQTKAFDYYDPMAEAFSAGYTLKAEGAQTLEIGGTKLDLPRYVETAGSTRKYWIDPQTRRPVASHEPSGVKVEVHLATGFGSPSRAQALSKLISQINRALDKNEAATYAKLCVALGAPQQGVPFFPASGIFQALAQSRAQFSLHPKTIKLVGARGAYCQALAKEPRSSEKVCLNFVLEGGQWKLGHLTQSMAVAKQKLEEHLAKK